MTTADLRALATPRRAPVGWGPTVVGALAFVLLATKQSIVVPFTVGQTPVMVVTLGCGILLGLCWTARQAIPAPHRPTTLALAFLCLTSMMSTAALMLRIPSTADATNSFLFVYRELSIAGLLLFMLCTVRTLRGVERVVQGIVLGASASAGFGVVEYVTGIDLASYARLPGLVDQGSTNPTDLYRAGAIRVEGAALHTLELSAVLTVAVPLAVGLAFAWWTARRRGWWFWGGCALVMVAGAAATVSRSSIAGMLAGLAVMALVWPVRRVVLAAVVALAGVVATLIAGVPLVSRLLEVVLGGSDDNSLGSRRSGIEYIGRLLPQHPLLGQGSGTYDVNRQQVLDNQYLSRLAESGLLGLAALLAMLAVAWWAAWTAVRRCVPASAEMELVNGLLGSVTAMALVGLIIDFPAFSQIYTLMFLLVGVAGCAATATRKAS